MVLDERSQTYACEWCAAHFRRRFGWGRRPLYCTRTCRQRAYEERRRGAFKLGLPAPTFVPSGKLRPTYERGAALYPNRASHALRPDGPADAAGRRAALCGAMVRATPFAFHLTDPANCSTCFAVAKRFPPSRHIDSRNDLGTLTAMIGALRGAHRASDAMVRATVGMLLGQAGAPAGSFGASFLPPEQPIG